MHRIFISDLHLEEPSSNSFLKFIEFMGIESARVDEIYILGDLVEMWIGDDDKGPNATQLQATLKSASSACKVYIMHGNRDFLLGEKFCDATGVTLLEDPHVIDDHILLSHGDILCTDDADYQAARALFRAPSWQKEILEKPLAEREMLGRALRAQSTEANANKSVNIMDANENAIIEQLKKHHADLLIHGHTHRPGRYMNRIVTGAWETNGWLCRQRDQTFQLECFSLANHYESETLDLD